MEGAAISTCRAPLKRTGPRAPPRAEHEPRARLRAGRGAASAVGLRGGPGLRPAAHFPSMRAAMKTRAPLLALALATLATAACDSGDKKAADAKADGKKDDAKADAKTDDVKAAADAGEGDVKAEPAKPVAMTDVSLESVGVEASLKAPEGAKVAEDLGAYTVKAGENFQLELHTGAADLAARKKEIEDNTVNKLKSFLTESDSALVYETEVMGQSEFHFVANVSVDDAKYHCEDTKGKAYAKADIDAMLQSCQSIAAAE